LNEATISEADDGHADAEVTHREWQVTVGHYLAAVTWKCRSCPP